MRDEKKLKICKTLLFKSCFSKSSRICFNKTRRIFLVRVTTKSSSIIWCNNKVSGKEAENALVGKALSLSRLGLKLMQDLVLKS